MFVWQVLISSSDTLSRDKVTEHNTQLEASLPHHLDSLTNLAGNLESQGLVGSSGL